MKFPLGNSTPPPDLVLPQNAEQDFRLYTYRDVAALCRVTLQTLQEWVKRGKVPSPKYFGGYTARFNRLLVEEIRKGPNLPGTYTPEASARSAAQTATPKAIQMQPVGSGPSTPKPDCSTSPAQIAGKKPAAKKPAAKKPAAKKPAAKKGARK